MVAPYTHEVRRTSRVHSLHERTIESQSSAGCSSPARSPNCNPLNRWEQFLSPTRDQPAKVQDQRSIRIRSTMGGKK